MLLDSLIVGCWTTSITNERYIPVNHKKVFVQILGMVNAYYIFLLNGFGKGCLCFPHFRTENIEIMKTTCKKCNHCF